MMVGSGYGFKTVLPSIRRLCGDRLSEALSLCDYANLYFVQGSDMMMIPSVGHGIYYCPLSTNRRPQGLTG